MKRQLPRSIREACGLFPWLLILSFLSAPVCRAQTPPVHWVQQAASSNSVVGYDVALDGLGFIYAVGSVKQTATFGNMTVGGGGFGGFITKYDPSGQVLWAKSVDGAYCESVATDGAGNEYVTCASVPDGIGATFGTTYVTNPFGNVGESFIAKVDSAGNFIWVQPLAASLGLYIYGVTVDAARNCYVTGGWSNGQAQPIFGGITITNFPTNNSGGFLAKFDASGNLLWATLAGGAGSGIGLDRQGKVFVTGSFDGESTWGSGSNQINLSSQAAGGSLFLAKFDSDGSPVWVSSAKDSTFAAGGTPLAIGSDGSVFIAELPTFDNHGTSGFVGKYSATGNLLWQQPFTNAYPASVAMDASNAVYVTGYYTGIAGFGGMNMASTSTDNMFLAKFDSFGNLQWAGGFESSGTVVGSGIVVTNLGQNVYLTGHFASTATFGNFTLTATTNQQGFFLASLGVGSPPPPDLSLHFYPGLTPGITIRGVAGQTYQLDYADSLQTDWRPWVRFVLPYSPYTLFDPAPNQAMRFYRAALIQQ
jgi:hypothetical protein